MRARHQRRSGHDQVDRSVDHREGLRRRLGDAEAAARCAPGKNVAVIGSGPGGPGRGRAAEPRRPSRDGVREVRSHRRPAALRHSRVQDGEALPEPAPVADGAGRRAVPHERERRRRRHARPAEVRVRRDRAGGRRRAAARSAGAGARAEGHPLRDGVPDAVEQARRRRSHCRTIEFISAKGKRVVIIGGGDTGADCLGTVHRQGALSVHQFELLPRPPDTRARRQPVAAVAERLPRVDRPRRRRRARVLGVDAALQRRRRRGT